MPPETRKGRERRFESIFFLNADETTSAPYNPRIRSIGNGDETMENRPAGHMMKKPPRKQMLDSSACESGEENNRPLTAQHMALLGEEFSACSALLSALGNENRQVIFLDLLRNWGGLRTYEIAEHVGLSKPTVSHHLSIMKKAGIVSVEHIGTVRVYHPSEMEKSFTACLESVSLR